MKPFDYDIDINENKKRRLNRLFDRRSVCGKTNTIIDVLRKLLVYYHNIYFYTPNLNQEKIQDLKRLWTVYLMKLVKTLWN